MAVKKGEIYCCRHCGICCEVIHSGAGHMICCGEEMSLLLPNSVDAVHEKHVPVINRYGDLCLIQVGSAQHPMTAEHNIMWIEIRYNDRVMRKCLVPGEKPEAEFCGIPEDAHIIARTFCNLHGLWISSQDDSQ